MSVLTSPAALPYKTRDLVREETWSEPSYANYAPLRVECPANQTWIRPAQSGLSSEETSYVLGRKQKVKEALGTYLAGVNLMGFDLQQYLDVLGNDSSKVCDRSVPADLLFIGWYTGQNSLRPHGI